MLGKAAVTIWCDVAAEVRDEFEDWHSHEHMPERLAIPGFLRGTRWRSEPAGSFFMLYELDAPETLAGPAYLARLNDPTPWSRKMMPQHRNMVRSLCFVREGYGGGIASVLATLRFSGKAKIELPRGKHLTSAHLLEARPMTGTPQTTEQKIRGGDATAERVALMGGLDAQAVRAAAMALADGAVGLYRPAYSLAAGEIA